MSTEDLRTAFKDASRGVLQLDKLSLGYASGETGENLQVITATGWGPAQKPFAIATEPFVGDPVTRSHQLAVDILAAQETPKLNGSKPVNTEGPSMASPSIPSRLHALPLLFDTFTAKIEAAAEKLAAKLETVGDHAVTGMQKMETVVDNVKSTADGLHAVAGSNHGPLSDTGDSR